MVAGGGVGGWDGAGVRTGIGGAVGEPSPMLPILLPMVPAAPLRVVPFSSGSQLYLLTARAVFHELSNPIKLVLQPCVITFNDAIQTQITPH